MKKTLTFFGLFAILFAVASCAGSTTEATTTTTKVSSPNAVKVVQDGDNDKSCRALVKELLKMNAGIKNLQPEGTTGNFYASLYKDNISATKFYKKFSNEDKAEYSAFIRRYTYLGNIAEDKGCRVHLKEYKSLYDLEDALKAGK